MSGAPDAAAPSVGRIVHVVSYGTPGGEFAAGLCRPAIIVSVGGEAETVEAASSAIGAVIFTKQGSFWSTNVLHNEDKAPGTWHWPERVP